MMTALGGGTSVAQSVHHSIPGDDSGSGSSDGGDGDGGSSDSEEGGDSSQVAVHWRD